MAWYVRVDLRERTVHLFDIEEGLFVAVSPLLQEFTATSTVSNDSLATIVKAAYKTKGYSFSSSILPDGKVTLAQLRCTPFMNTCHPNLGYSPC